MDINDDDNEIKDADVEDKRTIFSEEFDPKKREGVVNLKNDKVFTYIQVDIIQAKLLLTSLKSKSQVQTKSQIEEGESNLDSGTLGCPTICLS